VENRRISRTKNLSILELRLESDGLTHKIQESWLVAVIHSIMVLFFLASPTSYVRKHCETSLHVKPIVPLFAENQTFGRLRE